MVQGVDGKIEAKDVEFVLEHKRRWIGRRRNPPRPPFTKGGRNLGSLSFGKWGRNSGGRKGGFKEVEGRGGGWGVEVSKGLPQESRPAEILGQQPALVRKRHRRKGHGREG